MAIMEIIIKNIKEYFKIDTILKRQILKFQTDLLYFRYFLVAVFDSIEAIWSTVNKSFSDEICWKREAKPPIDVHCTLSIQFSIETETRM